MPGHGLAEEMLTAEPEGDNGAIVLVAQDEEGLEEDLVIEEGTVDGLTLEEPTDGEATDVTAVEDEPAGAEDIEIVAQGTTGQGTREDPIVVDTWGDLKGTLGSDPLSGESAENPTYYRLSGNVTAGTDDTSFRCGGSRHVVLDLNGKTIDRNKPQSGTNKAAIYVAYGDLTITGGVYNKDGTFIMKGGEIVGNTYDGVMNFGDFSMSGGEIKGHEDIGVHNESTFELSGTVDISGNGRGVVGKPIEPAMTVKDGKEALAAGMDYAVKFENNTDAGTAKVTVTGKGDYADASAVTANFKIEKAGSAVKKAPAAQTLTYTGKTLRAGTDYTVKYADNVTPAPPP